ncbi:MAG: BlaI/MecI/CopY family transcriptional regulator [Asticcacaulis sp.]
MTPPVKKPTEAELEILRALWARGDATVRDLHEALSARGTGYTTVLKTLQIMTEKGLVEREEAGKAHIYRPAMREEEMQTQLLRELSEKLFSGSPAMLAMHALSLTPASADELQQIRALIERRKGEK